MAAARAAELVAEIKATLTAERNGVTLGIGLVDTMVQYFVEVVLVKDVNEVALDSLLVASAEAAWENAMGARLPPIHRAGITRWVGGSRPPRAGLRLGPPSVVSSAAGEDEEEEDESELFGPKGPTRRDEEKLVKFKSAQNGLSGVRQLRLSFAIELGRVLAEGELLGEYVYGSHPALSKLAKDQKKAGMPTMSSIISDASNKRRELNTHLAGVVREYSEMGCVVESNMINQWWSETQSVSTSDAVMCDYIGQYFKKYPGCGIPDVVDVLISTRCTGASGATGTTPEQFGQLKEQLKETKSQLKDVKSEFTSMRQEISRLTSQVRNLKPGGGGGGGGGGNADGVKCHKCGEMGHFARDCPNKKIKKKKDEDEEKDDEEDP